MTVFIVIGSVAWCIAGLAAAMDALLRVDDDERREFFAEMAGRHGPAVLRSAVLISLVLFALFGPFTWSTLKPDGGGR